MDERLIIGAMSGTSADGVDAALVAIRGAGLSMTANLIAHHQLPYPRKLRNAILKMRGRGSVDLQELASLGREISREYAQAVKAVLRAGNVSADKISAVAAHGQTLFHDPPLTIQWFDPSLLAWEAQCPVISDFRRADCAAGGQGAPLVPFADYILFKHPTKNRVLLNIGGIANITWLGAGESIGDVIAFDTGPGNCISDALARHQFPLGNGFDEGGKLAMQGQPINEIVDGVLADQYFSMPPPKSTDGPKMLSLWETTRQGVARQTSALEPQTSADLFATACAITARTISDAIRLYLPGPVHELLVSGGGVENQKIMEFLAAFISDQNYSQRGGVDQQTQIVSTAGTGWPPAAKEAVAFALLGAATLDGLPSNVPSVTGAGRGVVLGSITPWQR